MTRLLALAIAALALLAWLNVRDLLRRASYEQVTDPADDVQPADPVTLAKGGPMPASTRFVLRNESGCEYLNPLTDRDRDWLDQTVRASLYPST